VPENGEIIEKKIINSKIKTESLKLANYIFICCISSIVVIL